MPLFEEGESFDIQKVLYPPEEYLDKLRDKVEEDAYERAYGDIMENVKEEAMMREFNNSLVFNKPHSDSQVQPGLLKHLQTQATLKDLSEQIAQKKEERLREEENVR